MAIHWKIVTGNEHKSRKPFFCHDGISKFPVYIVPILTRLVRDGKDLTRMAFLMAVYRHYLRYKTDDEGTAYDIAEPWMSAEDNERINSDDPVAFLSLSAFDGISLGSERGFTTLYTPLVTRIHDEGVIPVLASLLT